MCFLPEASLSLIFHYLKSNYSPLRIRNEDIETDVHLYHLTLRGHIMFQAGMAMCSSEQEYQRERGGKREQE